MNKRTYLNNQYTLYQYPNKPPILQYQDFTFSLTSEGTIHLTTPSKEFDSTANLFKAIRYWQDSHYVYVDTLIGIEIANAIFEVMLHNGLRFPYFMTTPYYDFINVSLKYYNIDVDFWMDYHSNKYLKPYLTKYVGNTYINQLKQLGIPSELTLPLTIFEGDEGYFMSLSFLGKDFLELPIPLQVVEMPNNKMKLHSYYRILCNLLYHSGYAITEDGKLYPNKCYILQEEHKALLENLLQEMRIASL